MKRAGLFVLLITVALFCASDAHSGGKESYCGRPKVWIEISPLEQESFVQGEETHFDIYVRSNRPDWWLKCYLKDAQMEGSFPDTETAVELEKVSNVEYVFDTGSLSKVGTNTLSVTLYKVNKRLIAALERVKDRLQAKVDFLRELLEKVTNPRLRRLLERLICIYERIIGRIEDRITAAKTPIATAEESFEVTPDTTPPVVEKWDPVCGAEDVSVFKEIRVTFSEPINPDTVTTNTFRVCVMPIVPPVEESEILSTKAQIRAKNPDELCMPIEGWFEFEEDNTVVVFRLKDMMPWFSYIYRGVGEYIEVFSTIEDRYGNGLEGVSDCYFMTLGQPTFKELAERFKPKIRRHKKEFLGGPVKVEYMLKRAKLLDTGPIPDKVVETDPTLDDLQEPPTGKVDKEDTYYLPYKKGSDWKILRDPQMIEDKVEPAVYWRGVSYTKDGKVLIIIQYWMFWSGSSLPTKDAIMDDFCVHEGDWELFQVLIEKVEPEEEGEDATITPIGVTGSEHYYGLGLHWDDKRLKKEKGRPIIYPACGSHAVYFEERTFTVALGTPEKWPGDEKPDAVKTLINREKDYTKEAEKKDYEYELVELSEKIAKSKVRWGSPGSVFERGPVAAAFDLSGPPSPAYRTDKSDEKLNMYEKPEDFHKRWLQPKKDP